MHFSLMDIKQISLTWLASERAIEKSNAPKQRSAFSTNTIHTHLADRISKGLLIHVKTVSFDQRFCE